MQQTRNGRRAFCELHPLDTPNPNETLKNFNPQGPQSTLTGLRENEAHAPEGRMGSGAKSLWQGMASKICLVPLAASLIPVAAGLDAGGLPMLSGQAVTTNGPSVLNVGAEPVVKLVDLLAPVPGLDTNWAPPMFWNADSVGHEWTAENLGPVFGVCQNRRSTNPDIFVASTSIYNLPVTALYREGPSGPGAIYKLDGTSGDISTFVDTADGVKCGGLSGVGTNCIPNTGPGLGSICYDATHNQFFATNFEDGKVYRIDDDGMILQAYDPFGLDNGVAGFAPHGELVWAVEVFTSRVLIFSVWLRDDGAQDTDWPDDWPPYVSGPVNNALFMVSLDITGAIDPLTIRLAEVIEPELGSTYSNPVSDLALGRDCWPLIAAERSMNTIEDAASDYALYPESGAHNSRALGFTIGTGLSLEPFVSDIWMGSSGMDCAGGAAYQQVSVGPPSIYRWWVTGDALHSAPLDQIYGMQSIDWPFNGTSTASSYLVDNDQSTLSEHGTWIGDVETYNSIGGACTPISDDCEDPTDTSPKLVSYGLGMLDFNLDSLTWVPGPPGTVEFSGDMWFSYTATRTGLTTVDTCASSSLVGDTKIAAWPGALGCPVSGTPLAVNDDYCGLTSRIDFPVIAGETYLLQVGSVPGTVGGPGVLTITEDDVLGSTYCSALPNSTNQPATIAAYGSPEVVNNDLFLRATQLPVMQFGYFLVSRGQGFVPHPAGSSGNLCLGGGYPLGRYVFHIQHSGLDGVIIMAADLTALPTPNSPFEVAALAGETWNFQAWFRDVPQTSNFSDAVSVTFQ